MYKFTFGYTGGKLIEIIIEKDGKVLHDIYRRRKDDMLFISDLKVPIFSLRYRNDKSKLNRIIENNDQEIDTSTSKFISAKYNQVNNIIVCTYTNKTVTLNYNKRTYIEKGKVGSKFKRQTFNNNTYQINPAVNRLIGHFSEHMKCIQCEEIPNMLIYKFEDEEAAKVLEQAVLLAAKEVAIFL